METNSLKRAFTIIEYLIVISIVGIITGLTLATYNSYSESSKLKAEVRKFIAVLSLAQKRAISSDVGAGCVNCTLDDYTVSWDDVTQQYSLTGTRTVAGVSAPFETNNYSIDTVNKNISILSTADAVSFSPLTGIPDSTKAIQFKNTASNECMEIDIEETGLISSTKITCP